jgi:F-type H+-transporting ATPase subunit b
MPQLDLAVFIPQIFWLFVIFAALYCFIAYSAGPKIAEVLKNRQTKISDDLAEASILQAKADLARQVFEKSQADARAAATEKLLSKRAELKTYVETEYKKLTEELLSKTEAAQARIDDAKEKAIGDVRNVATEVCVDIVSRISGLKLDDRAVSKIVNDKTVGFVKGKR